MIRVVNELGVHNQGAAVFFSQILDIVSLWDDLIDRDKEIDNETINEVFEIVLVHLPRNRFYREHFNELNPIIVSAMQNWHIANAIEGDAKKDKHISFIVRSSYVDLAMMCGYIIGGAQLAQHIGMIAREIAHDEGFGRYLESLRGEVE